MTNKPFEVQDDTIILNGVNLQVNEQGNLTLEGNPVAGVGIVNVSAENTEGPIQATEIVFPEGTAFEAGPGIIEFRFDDIRQREVNFPYGAAGDKRGTFALTSLNETLVCVMDYVPPVTSTISVTTNQGFDISQTGGQFIQLILTSANYPDLQGILGVWSGPEQYNYLNPQEFSIASTGILGGARTCVSAGYNANTGDMFFTVEYAAGDNSVFPIGTVADITYVTSQLPAIWIRLDNVNTPVTVDRLTNASGDEIVFDASGSLIMPTLENGGAIWWNFGYIDQDTTINNNTLRISAGDGVSIYSAMDTQRWHFEGTGNLTLPSGGDIVGDDVAIKGTSSVTIKVTNPINPLTTKDWGFGGTGILRFPDGTDQTTAYTGQNSEPLIPNTIKGFINLVGDRPNISENVWFESVVLHGDYAYVVGGDYYVNNSDNLTKIYKFDVRTGEQVWVKQVVAGRNATFDFNITSEVITITAIGNGGQGYIVGEELVFRGWHWFGDNIINRVIVIVDTVDEVSGAILTASIKPGYNLAGIGNTDLYGQLADNDNARGDAINIAYDTSLNKLVIVSNYVTGLGNTEFDSEYQWTNIYIVDPITGQLNQTVNLNTEGDIYSNSIKLKNTEGGVAVVGEKYGEFRYFGTLVMLAQYNGYFDILKSDLDPEHYPGGAYDYQGDFWVYGTGIAGVNNVDNVNYYYNLPTTVREGSGAEFTIGTDGLGGYTVSVPLGIATSLGTSDLATATGSGSLVVNVDNIVTPGGWGNWLVFPAGDVATTLSNLYTMNQIVLVTWGEGSTSLFGYVMVQIPGDGTVQFTPVTSDGSSAVAGTWYFPMTFSQSVPTGTNYLPGHKIQVLGSALGGVNGDNDAIITVDTVSGTAIASATISGTSVGSSTYIQVTGTNYQIGSGATVSAYVNADTGAISYNNFDNYGSGYVQGDFLTIVGTNFAAGATPANDATLVIDSIGGSGEAYGALNGAITGTAPTNALRITVNGVDFTPSSGSWSMKQNLGGEAFVWTPTWSNAIGGPSGDRFYDVCYSQDGNSIFAVGRGRYETLYDQALVVKFDGTTGAVLWGKDIKFSEAGTENREARAVCLVPNSSDLLVAGLWNSNITNNEELIVTRITENGVAVWQKTYLWNDNGNPLDFDYEINLKTLNGNIVISLEMNTPMHNRGLGYLIIDTNGVVLSNRVLSADGNSNYNYFNIPTPNFADVYTDADNNDYVVMAGHTYVPTDSWNNALLFKFPLDGYKNLQPGEWISIGEHILGRYWWDVTTVTPAFDSFTATEHIDTIITLVDQKGYAAIDPAGLLNVWTYNITNDVEGYLQFGDGSRQSFATDKIPQIPAANDYYLTEQDSGKHIFFESQSGRVVIPHWTVKNLPVGFAFTIVNTTLNNCYVDCDPDPFSGVNYGLMKLAGRNISTVAIGIPDSGSGSMVTFLKIKSGYDMTNTDANTIYQDVWMVSGPGDIYDND